MNGSRRLKGAFWPLLSGALIIGFFGLLVVVAFPHVRSVVSMGSDLLKAYRFQQRIASSEFRAECEGWENRGLSECLIREVEAGGFLDEPTSARRVMLHGAVLSALGKAYRGKWDSRYRSYSDSVFFLIHDLKEEERRTGKVIALTAHDPRADEVFHPAKVDAAEQRAMKSLNGRLWRTFKDRTQKMKEQGISENLGATELQNLYRAYELMQQWEDRIHWEAP